MKILLTGARGGLGSVLSQELKKSHSVLGLSSGPAKGYLACDLSSQPTLRSTLEDQEFDLILHAAAATHVDACERDPHMALQINTHATYTLRCIAEERDIPIIYISTNDVFSGQRGLYSEKERPCPINWYSQSKYLGEEMLFGYPKSSILRFNLLAWKNSSKTSYLEWLVSSLRAGKQVSILDDYYNSPLSVYTLSKWIVSLLDFRGTLHLASERLSRYEAAIILAEQLKLETSLIQKGKASDLNWLAPRPQDVSLDNSQAQSMGYQRSFKEEAQLLQVKEPK